MKFSSMMLAGLGLLALSAMPARALPLAPATMPASGPILVAEGCGPNAWRGPWGHCRDTPYTGPLPGGGWASPAGAPDYYGNGCPPGYWVGPWGHCRDTPFHGRLPDGTWQ